MIKSAMQGVAIFVGIQFVMGQVMGKSKPAASQPTTDAAGVVTNVPANSAVIPPYNARPHQLDEGAVWNPTPYNIAPMWSPDNSLDIIVYVSPSFMPEPLAKIPKDRIVVAEKDFQMGDFKDTRSIDTSFQVPREVQNNGTLWGHFYIGVAGSELDPTARGYDPVRAYKFIRPLSQIIPKKKVKKTKSLLASSNSTEEGNTEVETQSGPLVASYYHPNFTMSLIPDSAILNWPNMPPAVRQFVHLESTGARDGTGQNGWYYPILYVNTFWQLKSQMVELNSTVKHLPMHIDLKNFANWKFNILATMDENVKATAQQAAEGKPTAGGDGSEFEMLKEILLDTNAWLLGTTAVVSLLHMVFEMLAFKSDIVCSHLLVNKVLLTPLVPFPQQERQRWHFRPFHSWQCLHAGRHLPVLARQQ